MISELILATTNFLSISIISNHVIILDLWSIVHMVTGILLMFLIIKLKKPSPFTILLILLIIWELFEFTNYQLLENAFFAKEKGVNVIWDVLAGIGGGSLSWSMANGK